MGLRPSSPIKLEKTCKAKTKGHTMATIVSITDATIP